MSAKILHEDDSDAQRHIGCMNGIFHLFDRNHFLLGRRIGNHHKRLPPGQKGSRLDTYANEASKISSKAAIEKQRLSTDSSRSSVSSLCNSSSFSSMEDTKITHQSLERPCPKQLGSSEISKLVRDSILHRHARGITVKAASNEESTALTYVDSPRPSLPSAKATSPKKMSDLRKSLGSLPTFHKLKTTTLDRSSSLLHKESPRYSYDGSRELRSAVKIKELPRYSLDSKRPNPAVPYQELGSHRRESSLVAKLMGLEDPEEPEKVINCLEPLSRPSRSPKPRIPVEAAPWKRQGNLEGTQCLASQVNVSSRSVYGEMEKRLAQLEFAKSRKDLRALKHILPSMHNPKRGTETPTCSSPTIKKTTSPRSPRSPKPTKTEEKRSGTVKKSQNSLENRSPRKISVTASPRLQKKKPNPSDSPRRQTKKNSALSSHKSRSHSHDSSEQNNVISLRSEEMEVTSEYRPKKTALVAEDDSIQKPLICTIEQQPSPVSVLDPAIYGDESPSPVKMISNAFEDVEALNYDDTHWKLMELNFASPNDEPNLNSDATNEKKTTAADEDMNPDHGFISEILLASGLVKGLDSGNIITQNTFLALQEMKCGEELLQRRRLLFDVVNEILARKVESYHVTSKGSMKQQQLLKGLCSEIDRLPCKLDDDDEDCFRNMLEKDLDRQSEGWTDRLGDISGVAIDIERMIFRDLIGEVVSAEGAARLAQGSSHRRQLFQR